MSTSRRFTDLMMRMFARGRSAVPGHGMQRMPEQLAAQLQTTHLHLNTPVERVRPGLVEGPAGSFAARAVVVATDGWTAARLLPALVQPPPARGVTTVYHAAPPWPGQSPTLLVDGHGSPISNTVVLTAAAPEYSGDGRSLVSTSLVHGSDGPVPADPDPDGPAVRRLLAGLHRTDTSDWEHVATYEIPQALPGMPAPHPFRRPVRFPDGREVLYVAGDHRDTGSIQGALVSGRRTASAVLDDLGVEDAQ